MQSNLAHEVSYLQGRVYKLERQMQAIIQAYWKLEKSRRDSDCGELATGEALDILLAKFGEPQEPECHTEYL